MTGNRTGSTAKAAHSATYRKECNVLSENVRPNREKAVTALMTNPTIRAAAAECGIAEKTLHAWLNEEDFASKVKAAQEEVTRQAIGRILLSIGRSIETLEEIMQDATNNASPRVAAARTLLDYGFKVYELQTVQQRLEALERRLNV